MRVIPFSLCLVGCLIVGFIWVVQYTVFLTMSESKSEELWSGQCLPQNIEVIEDSAKLTVLCNKEEEVSTGNGRAIVAWVNKGKNPTCHKLKLWNSDEITWRCDDGSKK